MGRRCLLRRKRCHRRRRCRCRRSRRHLPCQRARNVLPQRDIKQGQLAAYNTSDADQKGGCTKTNFRFRFHDNTRFYKDRKLKDHIGSPHARQLHNALTIMSLHQPLLLDRRLDKGHEQRVRIKRLGFQFGVVLHADKPRVVVSLGNFRQGPVG